jgi:hypothetical protein
MLDKEIKRELPPEWNGVVPTEVFIREAEMIVEEANKKGITLRILGGLGIAIHCLDCRDFAVKLGRTGTGTAQRQEYSDIDLVSYAKQRERIKSYFAEIGYAKRRATLSSAASERQIYYHPKGWFNVDPAIRTEEPSIRQSAFGTTTISQATTRRIQHLHYRRNSQTPKTTKPRM